MKKLICVSSAVILAAGLAFGCAACENGTTPYSVFVPDGAPALSVARIAADTTDETYDVNVVDANTISTYVTGETPAADFAIMPVNAAVKLLGTGETYQMLGTVTHGNLYILKKASGVDITIDNLSELKGKTVGVINLANVPGLTFKAILSDNNIEYQELTESVSVDENKVNLKAVTAEQATPANTDCDYFVVPEPAATTKVSATGGKLSYAGDLQELYGGENGYPQAVLVAKTSVSSEAKAEFMDTFSDNEAWLKSTDTSAEMIVNAISCCMYKDDYSTSLKKDYLTKTTIANCSINFVKSVYCKSEVNAFMTKINTVASSSFGTASDGFFYGA